MPRLKYFNTKTNQWEYADTGNNIDLTNYATKTYVDNSKVAIDTTLQIQGQAADAKAVGDALAEKQPKGNYALKSDIPNVSGFLTEIPNEYVTETELSNKGFLTSYTETDPTVPSWAKQSTKPSYTKSEVGLGNVDNTSDANKPVSTAQATAIAEAKKAGTDAQSNLNTHTSNKSNPHGVTKAQVGLNNVDNVKQYSASNPPVVMQSEAPTDTSVIWVDTDDDTVDDVYDRYHVTPQMFGAKGDGIIDDTAAIQAALTNSNTVYIPEGSYVISAPIYVGQGKTLYGDGIKSILICKSPKDFIMLNAETTLRGLYIQMKSNGYVGNAITVNEKSLATANLNSGNVGIKIDDINITWHDYVYTQCANIELSLSGKFNGRDGFWGVTISNVRASGRSTVRNVGYFLRSYCAADNVWITGCQINNCTAEVCRWGLFMHTTDEDFTDAYADTAITHGVSSLTVNRYQHQCCSITKGFTYLRKGGAVQFTNCIAWDWHLASNEYKNHPYCMDYERFSEKDTNTPVIITPVPGIRDFMAILPDGTFTSPDYDNMYEVSRSIGTQYLDLDLLPKQFDLGNSMHGACIYHTTKLDRIFADNTYYGVHFQLFDNHTGLKNISVVLSTATPYVITDRPLFDRTKFGYIKTDTEFKLYIYSERTYDFTYSYLINNPIANNSLTYSGYNRQHDYNKTINTFGWPNDERYLKALPDGLVEITTIQCLSDIDKTEIVNEVIANLPVYNGEVV